MLTLIEKKLGRKKFIMGGRSRRPFNPTYANDNTAMRPEAWASEAIRLLFEDMVYPGLVYRDYSPTLAKFGETVHVHKPGTFTAKRKQNDLDAVTEQDATSTDTEVKLNQRAYVTFIIGDGDRSKSFKDLIAMYLEPAIKGEAQLLDRCVGGQVMQFLGNRSGGLGQMSPSNAHDYLIDARGVMNVNVAPLDNRRMGLASPTETVMQKVDLFKSAERRGDGGRALTEALLGRVDGFDNFLSLNTPSPRGGTTATATTLTAAAAAGASVINVTSAATTPAGAYLTVDGDYTPLRVSSVATLALTLNRPLLRAVANAAAVRPMATGLINQASAIGAGDTTAAVSDGYPAGWMKEIVVDGTGVPKLGQLVAFKAVGGTVHTAEYCIVWVNSGGTQIMLDRPLEDTLADNAIVCYGPDGDYNFMFQRDALALVNRPLALPDPGTGVRAATAEYANMAMRVTMTYDGSREGTRVTIGSLFGLKKLQDALGGALLG